jgi:hypothetical protein
VNAPGRTVNGPELELLNTIVRAAFDQIVASRGRAMEKREALEINSIQLFIERTPHEGRRSRDSGALTAAMVLWLFGFRVRS